MHLIEPKNVELPSIEGILVSRRLGEYVVGLPKLLTAAGGNPSELESRWLVVPKDRVAFYEILN